ncbi:MAG: TIGR02147 family protein [Pseudomonadota bacterium]
MQVDTIKLPDIFDFTDYRAFLRERLVALHSNNPKYSQRWVAKNAGFQSLHLLSMILSGARNLAKDKVEPLSQVLKLDSKESEYFKLIHALAEASNHEEQKSILREIKVAFKNGLFSFFGEEAVKAITTWYLGAIVQLTVLKDFQESPLWIANRLGISESEAVDGLEFLLKHQFLVRENGVLVRSQPSLHNFGKLPPLTVASYHMQIFEKAYQSLVKTKEHKYVETLTIAIAKNELPQFKDAIKKFCREMDLDAESSAQTRSDVWQLAVAFFSLTPVSEE